MSTGQEQRIELWTNTFLIGYALEEGSDVNQKAIVVWDVGKHEERDISEDKLDRS